MMIKLYFASLSQSECFFMANPGRPKKEITKADLDKLSMIIGIPFHTKKQKEYLEIRHKRSDFTIEEVALIKENIRQQNSYESKMDLLDLIRHKSKTSIKLTALEQEILGYDFSDQDGFFNCLNALTTYSKIEKIAKSEIERAESKTRQEAIKKTLKQQTDGQMRRKENERRKYFLGGVVLKYAQFLKENYLIGAEESEEAILQNLLEDFIVSSYLSDVTGGDVRKANELKKNIKSKHSDMIEKIRFISDEVRNDKRK
jgi:hypothetical protein